MSLVLYYSELSCQSVCRGPLFCAGLKVIGGQMTDSGRLGAFITKVKRGSIADAVGHLKPGKSYCRKLIFLA